VSDPTSIAITLPEPPEFRIVRESPCGYAPLDPTAKSDEEVCDRLTHRRRGFVVRRCPAVVVAELRKQFVSRADLMSGKGFETHDVERARAGGGDGQKRVDAAKRALDAMVRFSGERHPSRGVVLSGPTGTGKSRLLFSSHFLRLERGWPSVYVRTGDLRLLFRDAESRDERVSGPARDRIARIARARVVHLDDLGDVADGGETSPSFGRGIKALTDMWRDETGTAIALTMNLRSFEARRHPDIGDRVLSRLCQDADCIGLDGEDQRIARRV
jgi:DNA replication protein DnaC